ncbi:MAG TPA: GWxTD domain-containing protein [Candidatus Aminicenantes bacterium]|nr:GWxTD domain-containing protein [Candidatus Aminicenantes bacterium]
MNVSARLSALVAGAALVAAACASNPALKRLDPKSRDFISQVRYTITKEERQAFLALAPEAREDFIEDFWERRDPTPGTPENEYRTEYYNRITRSNRLFSGGGSPGWLQDRGRVYITLGPPDNRITYPRGITFYGLPTEIWWYGLYSIVFIDEYWNDNYRIAPESAGQIAVITQAQTEWNRPQEDMPPPGEKPYASVLAGLEIAIEVEDAEKARFSLLIPYENIWLKSAGDSYQATLEVTMTVAGEDGAEVWEFSRSYPLDIPAGRLKEVLDQDFEAEAVAPLKPGSYALSVVVTNTNDGSKAALERAFKI